MCVCVCMYVLCMYMYDICMYFTCAVDKHKTWITLGKHSIPGLFILAYYFLLQTSGQYFINILCNRYYSVKFFEAVSYEKPRMLYVGLLLQGSDLFSGFHSSLVLGCFSEYSSPLCTEVVLTGLPLCLWCLFWCFVLQS